MFENTVQAAGILALGIGLAASARGKESRVERTDVPSAVLAAVSARYPNPTTLRFVKEEAHGKVTFEVTVELGAERREIDVSPTGKILAEERAIPFRDVPSVVREAFARSRFARDSVLRVEQSTEHVPIEKVSYELLVKVGDHKSLSR